MFSGISGKLELPAYCGEVTDGICLFSAMRERLGEDEDGGQNGGQ